MRVFLCASLIAAGREGEVWGSLFISGLPLSPPTDTSVYRMGLIQEPGLDPGEQEALGA